MTQFSDFAFIERIHKTLEDGSYTKPTPIQSQAIPHALEGRDILGIAQTGTGKTAAFSLPSLNRLASKKLGTGRYQTRMLVLAPTRELATQIAESMTTYGKGLGLYITTAFGGVPINRQKRILQKGVDVLVATPGRLLDLYEQNALDLSMVEILVLDEADQMLDLGFMVPLKRIVTLLPKKRQSLFFSATMPKSISELAGQYLVEPVKVEVAPAATTAEKIEQICYFPRGEDKSRLLAKILREEDPLRVLIFTRTKHGADRLVTFLERDGFPSAAIHGNKSQPQREKALNAFKKGQITCLVATDIAARGIDVSGVSHVINYELPNVPEQYVHRIGRTARAEAEGMAISLVGPDERQWLRDIERLTKIKLTALKLPMGYDAPNPAELPPPQMGGGGKRGSFAARPARGNGGAKAGTGRPASQGKPRSGKPGAKPGGGNPYAPKPKSDAPRGDRRPSRSGEGGGKSRQSWR